MYSHRPDPLDAALQQRDREIGRPGPARIGLGQKDRAEAIGDLEMRIERRDQIEHGYKHDRKLALAARRSPARAALRRLPP
jgi:hypothetical protein